MGKQTMKILVVMHYQNDGSPCAIFVHDQVKALRAAGNEVRVIVPIVIGKKGIDQKRFFPAVQESVIGGIPFVFVRYLSASNYGSKGFNTRTAIYAVRLHWNKILGNFTPDIIHAHTIGFDSQLGIFLKKLTGCPLLVTTHGSDTFVPYLNGEKQYLKKAVEGVDRIVAVSTKLEKFLLDCSIAVPICVIPNGFNAELIHTKKVQGFERLMDCGERAPQDQVITINQTGNLIERKHADITIRAFAELKKKYKNIQLVIVGEGPKKDELICLTQKLGVSDSVIFKGRLPNKEVLAEMARSHFFVMPSVNEGFGIVYLETMASGCVVIGTQGEGIQDVIADGENGFLVRRDQYLDVKNVLEWCLENKQKARIIAHTGRETALDMTWTKNAAANESVYRELLRCKRI